MTQRLRNTRAARTMLTLLLAAALGLAAVGAAFAQRGQSPPHDPAICLEYDDSGNCVEYGPNPAHPDHQS